MVAKKDSKKKDTKRKRKPLTHLDKVTIGEHCFQYVVEERERSGRAFKVH